MNKKQLAPLLLVALTVLPGHRVIGEERLRRKIPANDVVYLARTAYPVILKGYVECLDPEIRALNFRLTYIVTSQTLGVPSATYMVPLPGLNTNVDFWTAPILSLPPDFKGSVVATKIEFEGTPGVWTAINLDRGLYFNQDDHLNPEWGMPLDLFKIRIPADAKLVIPPLPGW